MDIPQKDNETTYIDDATEKPSLLLEQRLPWLLVGLVGAIASSIFVSRFESVLASKVSLAFFLPAIVYLSDAVGTQTETIYIRNLGRPQVSFLTYLVKEFTVGLGLGLIFGFIAGLLANFWLGDQLLAWTVGWAMLINITIAPVLAVVMSTLLQKEHTDPALGSGPFTTVIQDIISLIVYFSIASLILFR